MKIIKPGFRKAIEAIKKHCRESRCCDCCFELPRNGCEMEGDSCLFRVGACFPQDWKIDDIPWHRLME